MARIRTIKPDFWEDEKIATLPIPCRLFYIGVWGLADDWGLFRANPVILKAKLFPYDENLRLSELNRWLDALTNARMIIPISHNGESYYAIRTFRSHQKIDKRYGKPLIDEGVLNVLLNEDTAGAQCVPDGDTPQESSETVKDISNKGKDCSLVLGYEKFSFDFVEQEYSAPFVLWLEYKKDCKQKYSSQKSLEACYRQLKEKSGHNPTIAKSIVEQSMANNWAGLFELKQSVKSKSNFANHDNDKQYNEF